MDVPPRAVLDSSVLVPAWSRLLLSTLAAARPVLYTPVWCEWVIAETWRVLAVQRLRRLPAITPADERTSSSSRCGRYWAKPAVPGRAALAYVAQRMIQSCDQGTARKGRC